jgi:hypothetical protein
VLAGGSVVGWWFGVERPKGRAEAERLAQQKAAEQAERERDEKAQAEAKAAAEKKDFDDKVKAAAAAQVAEEKRKADEAAAANAAEEQKKKEETASATPAGVTKESASSAAEEKGHGLPIIKGVKTYQVTGSVLEISDGMIAVQKGRDRWEFLRDATTDVSSEPKVGDKVTVSYQMLSSDMYDGFKSYQFTGPILEINSTMMAVQKGKDRWEVARTETSPAANVGDKFTAQYVMHAVKIQNVSAPSKSRR